MQFISVVPEKNSFNVDFNVFKLLIIIMYFIQLFQHIQISFQLL